jgi:hypothetical protein
VQVFFFLPLRRQLFEQHWSFAVQLAFEAPHVGPPPPVHVASVLGVKPHVPLVQVGTVHASLSSGQSVPTVHCGGGGGALAQRLVNATASPGSRGNLL